MTTCVVDVKLNSPRRIHTGDGNLVCGGWAGTELSSCYNLVTGATINLNNQRGDHTSWSTPSGIYLMGGHPSSSSRTTELVSEGSTTAGFALKYDSAFVSEYYLYVCK